MEKKLADWLLLDGKEGELAIYARSEYAVPINNQLSRNVEGIFESLFLELHGSSKKKTLIGEI